MTNHQQTDDMLPIDEKLSRDTFAHIYNGIDHLMISLLNATSHNDEIGFPDEESTKRMTRALGNFIAAAAQATAKLHRQQARQRAATTAKPACFHYDPNNPRQRNQQPQDAFPPNSEPPHQNAPQRSNTKHVDDPPSTDNLDNLDKQLYLNWNSEPNTPN